MPAKSKAQQHLMAAQPWELGYIAGFLDGEGYITIQRANRCHSDRQSPTYRLCVGFTNRDIGVLQWLQQFTGGTINAKARRKDSWSPAFELTTTQRGDLHALLTAVQPYVKIKRKQVDLGLAFLDLGLARLEFSARGKTWPRRRAVAEDIDVREGFKLELGRLNARGVQCQQ